MKEDIEVGTLVISKCGRDRQRRYLVWDIVDNHFVLLVDGDNRRIQKPKRKNRKHIHLTKKKAEDICRKLSNNEKVCNAEIRRAIEELEEQTGEDLLNLCGKGG